MIQHSIATRPLWPCSSYSPCGARKANSRVPLARNRYSHAPFIAKPKAVEVYKFAEQGLRNGTVFVRPSVPAWADSSKRAAAGLLLWARCAGDIDRLLPGRQLKRQANAGSATLSAFIGTRKLNTDRLVGQISLCCSAATIYIPLLRMSISYRVRQEIFSVIFGLRRK